MVIHARDFHARGFGEAASDRGGAASTFGGSASDGGGAALDRASLGKRAELAAERHLASRGYRVLERRYRTRFGEVDLVMQDSDTVVFVEVRMRSSRGDFGSPEETVDRAKQIRIAKAAMDYLHKHGRVEAPARFDVVSIVGEDIRHVRDAFRAAL